MANPNRAFANMPKRSPIEQIDCRNKTAADELAAEKRAAGFDAKSTMRRYGNRKNLTRVFTVWVYEKL